jgi:diguanylate cyclase (GGDEF)-like protein/PAS domain S-box-containing protein
MPRTTMAAERVLALDAESVSSWVLVGAAFVTIVVLVWLLLLNLRARRRLAETSAQLAESEARMRRLAESVPAGIFQADAQGRRVYVNPKLAEITGDASTRVSDRPWLVVGDDEPRVYREWAEAAEKRSTYVSKFRIRRPDSAIRWVAVEARPLLDEQNEVTGWVGSVLDVTEETAAIGELRRFSEIVEATPDLVAMVDTNGLFTFANAAARARFGIADDDAMRQLRAIDVYAKNARALFLGEALPTANRLGVWSGEIDLLMPDGSEVPVSQVLVAHRRPDGSIDYYSSITRDLSERRVLEEQLAQAGLYDALTGLPNRTVLAQALGDAMDAATHADHEVAVLLLDLDQFKLVNDSFGHDSGDLMLRLVTQRLHDIAGPHDLVARFGGDVFCLVATETSGAVEALDMAERITQAMTVPFSFDGDEVFLSFSVGISMSGDDDALATPETMLRDADSALHRAKEKGRARIELFVEDYRAHAVNRLRTANDLHRALDEQEFRVVYQPEVDLRTGRSPASKRWSAGITRSVGSCRRRSSSRSRSRPA